MKNLLISFFLLSFFQVTYSQNIDSRLLKNYSEAYLSELIANDSQEYNLLVYAIDNACYLTQVPGSKSSEFTKTIAWTLDSTPSFLDLNLKYGIVLENFNQYIQLEGTDQMLVVKSRIVLKNELNTKK